MRGATRSRRHGSHYVSISTHAPLAGRDVNELTHPSNHRCISTHAPLAGRDEELTDQGKQRCEFQPTRPLRGATAKKFSVSIHTEISTHAPLAGRDVISVSVDEMNNPISTHAPLAGRDDYRDKCGHRGHISTHAPLAGRDEGCWTKTNPISISTHAPLAGRDSKSVQITMHIFAITDKFQMLLHRMPPVRAFCSFLMQENHADFGCEPPK